MEERTVDGPDPVVNDEDNTVAWLKHNGLILALLAVLAVIVVAKGWNISAIAMVVVGLGLVIFVHELGHFVAAKACDVYVETFSIGFGPALPFCKHKFGETTYKVGLIPLGGYVKMLGEGAEGDEPEDDPRSYKNKPVGQRMIIISAGVTMNMITAVIGFICIYMGPGIDKIAGIVGATDPGSPAWEAGVRTGAQMTLVGSKVDPYFEQVKPSVMFASSGEAIPFWYKPAGSNQVIKTSLQPRYDAEDRGHKLIGVSFARTTTLAGLQSLNVPPCVPGSAASRATPALASEDVVIATTKKDGNPGQLYDLPRDPRTSEDDRRDYFELYKRLVDLAGEPITLRVKNAAGETSEVTVPPAFAPNFGMVMRMGPIAAIRNDVNAGTGAKPEIGDVIERVELKTEKGLLRLTNSKSTQRADNVEERTLDPIMLPFELQRWAASAAEPKEVKLTVGRLSGHKDDDKHELTLHWDDSWKYDRQMPLSARSPLSIPGLGLAYKVETSVVDVAKGGSAELAGVKKDDVVTGFKVYYDDAFKNSTSQDLKTDEWAFAAYNLMSDSANPTRMDLTLKRGAESKQVSLQLNPSAESAGSRWPLADRGLQFAVDTRHVSAGNPGQAIVLGWNEEIDIATNIYKFLLSVARGDVSILKNANGPISIAHAGYEVASRNSTQFIWMLCMLSVNLAVLNFLPIPVLDGGHMVFLLYEKLVGRPAPELIRTSATFAGMALLLSLMACVLVIDVRNVFFKN